MCRCARVILRPCPGLSCEGAHSTELCAALLWQVWMLQPIALEEQARELLKAGDFDQALQLADVAAGEGAPSWVEDAYAEAAFLLIHGGLPSQHASHFLSYTQHALDERVVPVERLH